MATERYEVGELLGKGGMGAVYRARDRRLDRTVAIKFILGADPNLTVRLLREARAQARIEHPNICRVHEVGEVDGRAYIALQFVDGEPLGRAAAGMSLDEKVTIVRDVALALHEAHRLGIVHRDVKPANVLVERREDGRWVPIVMDFGLAREATLEAGLTVSGQLIGTPAYMPPELARGDVHAADRRSDVYSLGATLYELLVGRPPFGDAALAAALSRVIHEPPVAPRTIEASLPVDLETIVLKCLEKEPGQRYASARALAEDLTRYLDGEPILGRRPSPWQRLRASVRRHRRLYMLGAWSAAIIIALGVFGLRSFLASRAERARSADRARLAEQLGREAKDIEWLLRAVYTLPLHDTRPERDLIRTRMREIAATEHDLGELGDALVHEALGRGHLALHEWREAADELERAMSLGLDTPELHGARGRALGELYDRALREARRSGDKAWLAARQAELEQQYLVPALVELELGRDAGDQAALLDALVPLYQHDEAAAEARARAAAKKAPWLFEAEKVAGDAAFAAGLREGDRGAYDAARSHLERACSSYARAAEMARSDATVHEAAARAWLERAELDFRQGRPAKQPIEQALAAVERAIAADPERGAAFTTKAYVLMLRTRARVDGDIDRRAILDDTAAAAERAVAIDPRDAGAWDALGNAHVARGKYELYHGGDGEPWWRKALVELAAARSIRPNDPWAHNDAGVAHRWIGTSLDASGKDPLPEFRAALADYQAATAIDPGYLYAWTNQADIQALIAEYEVERGEDPSAAADAALRAGERGLAIDPSLEMLMTAMARAHLARIESGRLADPTSALAAARGFIDRAEKVAPSIMTAFYYRARAARAEARHRRARNEDAGAAIAVGRTAIAEALRLAPSSGAALLERAELALVAGTDLAQARADSEHAITLDARDAHAQRVAAEVCLAIARSSRDRATVEAGLAHIERAITLNPRLARARAVRDELARLR